MPVISRPEHPPRPGPLGTGRWPSRGGGSGARRGLRAHRRLLAALPVPGTPSPPLAPPRSCASRGGDPAPRPEPRETTGALLHRRCVPASLPPGPGGRGAAAGPGPAAAGAFPVLFILLLRPRYWESYFLTPPVSGQPRARPGVPPGKQGQDGEAEGAAWSGWGAPGPSQGLPPAARAPCPAGPSRGEEDGRARPSGDKSPLLRQHKSQEALHVRGLRRAEAAPLFQGEELSVTKSDPRGEGGKKQNNTNK